MNLNAFMESRQGRWSELESLVGRAAKRAERLPAADIFRLGASYREVAADLAIARRHFPGDPVVTRLERLAVSARSLVYEREGRRYSLVEFLADGYWRLLWDRRAPLLLAATLLIGPALLGALWALADAQAATRVVPPGFLWVTEEQGSTDQGYGVVGLAGFSTFVMFNNIRVTLAAFALGVTWGLGTSYILLANGLILGAVSGLAVGVGNGDFLLAAVAAHGVLELSCMVVGGAAGLSLGRAILRPGKKTRRAAMVTEAASAFRIAAGTVPWLVAAGLVEGYISRNGVPPVPSMLIGVTLGALFWGLLLWRGPPRSRPSVPTSGPGLAPGGRRRHSGRRGRRGEPR